MTFILRAVCAAFIAVSLTSQTPDQAKLREDVFTLASPAMEGRATGTEGQRRAAEYLAKRFAEVGLSPLKGPGIGGSNPYSFSYTLLRTRVDEQGGTFRIGKVSFKVGQDVLTSRTQGAGGEVVFIGYGLHIPVAQRDDFAGLSLKGKWAVVLEGAPDLKGTEPEGWAQAAKSETKLQEARALGVEGVIFIQTRPDKEAGFGRMRIYLDRAANRGTLSLKGSPARESQTFWLSAGSLKALSLDVKTDVRTWESEKPMAARNLGTLAYQPKLAQEELPASDLIGLIPGTDPILKDEFIVLSAHHDHVGMEGGKLHPGADDNASGTAAILEVARLLKDSKPKRSILVLSVSGEELGLWGSQAFLAAPPVELSRIKADINLDMVGRNAVNEVCVTPARVEGAVGTLTQEARAIALRQGLKLTLEADQYWYRSDHYTFAKRGIPSIFFFGGMHADYHQPSDTPDKINFEKLARVVSLARELVLNVANAEEPPKCLPKATWSAWTWPSPTSPVMKPR